MEWTTISITIRYYVAVSKTGIDVLKRNLEKIDETIEQQGVLWYNVYDARGLSALRKVSLIGER